MTQPTVSLALLAALVAIPGLATAEPVASSAAAAQAAAATSPQVCEVEVALVGTRSLSAMRFVVALDADQAGELDSMSGSDRTHIRLRHSGSGAQHRLDVDFEWHNSTRSAAAKLGALAPTGKKLKLARLPLDGNQALELSATLR